MGTKKRDETGTDDVFRARLDQIINMKHERVRRAEEIDWNWIDGPVADCLASEGRPETETRFLIGIVLLKQIYGPSDKGHPERNSLKGHQADQANAVLTATGHNLRLLLQRLRMTDFGQSHCRPDRHHLASL